MRNLEKHRPKLLQFSENRRPPYWGTWRKQSKVLNSRRPFAKEKVRKLMLISRIVFPMNELIHRLAYIILKTFGRKYFKTLIINTFAY